MVEDQREGSHSNITMNIRHDDQVVAFEDYALKARKPYTITKQREKWTQEEHTKFLEALKLYGRAWRQIEEHVGNKTAVQIRSHAQKFFSKVVRETTCVNGSEVEPIEIPPPRAKKKPSHPYPRKLSFPSKKQARISRSSSCSLGSNHENLSPKSVLSVGGVDSCLPKVESLVDENGSSLSNQENDHSSLTIHEEKTCADEILPESVSTQSMKLFGKIVFVTTRHSPQDTINTLPWNSMPTQKESWLGCQNGNGLVGYKRCVGEKNTHSFMSMSTGEEREELRVRLCL